MRKLFILIVLLLVPTVLYAANASTTATGMQQVPKNKQVGVIVVTLVADDTDGSFNTIQLNQLQHNILGWYLVEARTDPGSTAPQDNYDITLVGSVSGIDFANANLMNRDTTTSEAVYLDGPIVNEFITVTVTGNNVNSAEVTLYLFFIKGVAGKTT